MKPYAKPMPRPQQILFMQLRMLRLFSARWGLGLPQTARLFRRYALAELIEQAWEIFHTEGDWAVYAELLAVLAAQEVRCPAQTDADPMAPPHGAREYRCGVQAVRVITLLSRALDTPATPLVLHIAEQGLLDHLYVPIFQRSPRN